MNKVGMERYKLDDNLHKNLVEYLRGANINAVEFQLAKTLAGYLQFLTKCVLHLLPCCYRRPLPPVHSKIFSDVDNLQQLLQRKRRAAGQ